MAVKSHPGSSQLSYKCISQAYLLFQIFKSQFFSPAAPSDIQTFQPVLEELSSSSSGLSQLSSPSLSAVTKLMGIPHCPQIGQECLPLVELPSPQDPPIPLYPTVLPQGLRA